MAASILTARGLTLPGVRAAITEFPPDLPAVEPFDQHAILRAMFPSHPSAIVGASARFAHIKDLVSRLADSTEGTTERRELAEHIVGELDALQHFLRR